jgi:hypothetical protein
MLNKAIREFNKRLDNMAGGLGYRSAEDEFLSSQVGRRMKLLKEEGRRAHAIPDARGAR